MPNRSRFAPDILQHRTDPDLPGLTARPAAYRRQAFALHIHEAWSVGLVLSGATTVRLSGKAARIEAGSLACIGPGQPHACNPVAGTRLGYMFYLAPEALPLVADPAENPAFLSSAVRSRRRSAALVALFRAMGRSASRLEKETLLHQALAPLFGPGRQASPRPPAGSDGRKLELVEEYLRTHFRENVSLTELAGLVGLGPTGLLRRFKAWRGLPPQAFQNQLRVLAARQLLEQGRPAAQVAQEVGFTDQSHLIRTFTPLVGATPGQYQQAQPVSLVR
jgi:AraC-like DNA-binding protein